MDYTLFIGQMLSSLRIGAIVLFCVFAFVVPFVTILYLSVFKIKCKYRELNGDGHGGFSLGKERTTKFRYTDKTKNSWTCLSDNFGFTKKTHPPFSAHLVYGKTVYAVKLPNGDFVPCEWTINKDDQGKVTSSLHAVPAHLRAWQAMEHQKTALEWKDKKADTQALIIVFVACATAVIIVGAAIYFAYKFGSPSLSMLQANTGAMEKLASALGSAGGVPPV